MLRARGARGRRESLLQDADAPHQSDPRATAARREQRMTERRVTKERANEREIERKEEREPRAHTKTIENLQQEESVARKKIETRKIRDGISQSFCLRCWLTACFE